MKSMTTRALLSVVAAALFAAAASAKPYAQLSSTENQAAAGTPKAVTLNSTDAAKGITNANGVVTLPEAGTYFVIAAGQVGSTTGGKGTVRLWMRQNGKDVDNSNTAQAVEGGFTAVLVCQGVVEAKAGDKLELAFSATPADQGLGLIVKKPAGEPAIPSMIVIGLQGRRRRLRPALQHRDASRPPRPKRRHPELDRRRQGRRERERA